MATLLQQTPQFSQIKQRSEQRFEQLAKRRIAVLDGLLANQIAAGEVIERPHSVIKEILENSLDAGATNLDITIEDGGLKLIRVRDDGCGIVKDDLTLALCRHATSKIRTVDDLFRIRSLGFRGEALASIASIARVTLMSRARSAEELVAWRIDDDGSGSVAVTPCAHPYGTTIEVCDLFFNVPARRKFLRTAAAEFMHIAEIVRRLALTRFDVSISLQHNAKKKLYFPVVKNQHDALMRVATICGEDFAATAIEIGNVVESVANAVENAVLAVGKMGAMDQENKVVAIDKIGQVDSGSGDAIAAMQLVGWIGAPSFTRTQADMQYFYVNGRIVRDKTLAYAVRHAYQDVMPTAQGGKQRYPAVVLYFFINHELVDVNVHPTKSEVRFRDNHAVHNFVMQVVRKALARKFVMADEVEERNMCMDGNISGTANGMIADGKMDAHTDIGMDINMHVDMNTNMNANRSVNGDKNDEALNEFNKLNSICDFSVAARDLRYDVDAVVADVNGVAAMRADINANDIDADDIRDTNDANYVSDYAKDKSDIAVTDAAKQSSLALHFLGDALAQLNSTYILAQNARGLVIIDAHAAHERITYEQLKAVFWRDTALARQELLHPLELKLSAREAECVEIYSEIFQQLGLDVMCSNDDVCMVRSLPVLLQDADIERLVRDIVADLSVVGESFSLEKNINAVLARMACHSSVRAGRSLSVMEMNALLRRIECTENGGQCSHGRPTWIQITREELEKMFKRRGF